MSSPVTRALLIAILGIVFVISFAALASYSMIPSVGMQIELSIFALVAGVIIYYIFSAVASKIKEPKLRFDFNKLAIIMSLAIVAISLLVVWIQQLTFLAISLGLVAAGISFSLQQPITSLVGWLVLAFERPLSVGDTDRDKRCCR